MEQTPPLVPLNSYQIEKELPSSLTALVCSLKKIEFL